MASLLQVKRSNTDTDGSGLTVSSGELAYSTCLLYTSPSPRD